MQQSFFYLSAEMTLMKPFNEKTLSIYQDMQFLDKKINLKVQKLNLKITTHRLIFTNHPKVEEIQAQDTNYVYFVVSIQYIKMLHQQAKLFSSKIDHLKLETSYGDLNIYGDNLEGPAMQIKGSMERKEWLKVQQQEVLSTSYMGMKSEIQKKEQQTQQSIITVNQTFSGGFDELFKNATELKEISDYIKNNIKKGENSELDEILSKIGCFQVLDKDEDLYYEKLAEQVYKLCQELFPKMGGIVSLLDIYYYFNKKRTSNLLSPEEVLKAALQFEKLKFQAKLSIYDGIRVLESTQYDSEKDFENTIGKHISYEQGLTAEQLAKRIGISVMICKIKLRNAIATGKVCIDNRIEESERQRLTDNLSQLSTRAPSVIVQQQESLPFIAYTTENVDRQQKQQEENEKKQKLQAEVRKLIVPTQENEIKSQLRQLGQPVTFFGEKPADRRERLRKLLSEHLMQFGRLPQFFKQSNNHNLGNLENEYFLYEGKEELRAARIEIAKLSLHRAALRVEKQRLRRLTVDALSEDQQVLEELSKIEGFKIQMSQFGDTSGISRAAISPNQEYLATAGGSGEAKLWGIETAQLKSSMLGHLTKCHSIAFHPQSTISLSPTSFANVATTSADLLIRLWTLDFQSQQVEDLGVLQKSIVLKGHEDRVNKVIYHQDGKRLISLGYDKTWRLWDIETQQELMVQTGHSRALYTGSLHPDGSILFTGDMGGCGMGWDLRMGKAIIPFTGHVKGILASDFSTNGHHLATGGDDNFIRIWDIRRRNVLEKIPAHIKLVSDLKFQPNTSRFLISSSYDGTIKYWNSRDWSLHTVYEVPETKITSVCITNDIKTMIHTGLDRKFVIWQ